MNRNYFVFLLASILILGSCGGSRSAEVADAESAAIGGMAVVSGVELTGEGAETSFRIRSNQELRYNVFKLTGPDRVMVDLIDARVASDLPSEMPGNDLVKTVRVQSIEDSLSNLVRIELELSASANYLSSLDGNDLKIALMPAVEGAPMPMASESAVEVPSVETPAIAVPTFPSDLPPLPEMNAASEDLALTPLPEAPLAPIEAPVASPEPVPAPVLSMPEPDPVPPPSLAEVAPEAAPTFVPPSAASETQASNESAKQEPSQRIIVEPEGPASVRQVETQEIPSEFFTEGTSTLTGLSSRIYTGNRVSLEFQDAQIQDVLRLIADVSKLNIILADDVKGTLTLKLIDVPWDQALDIILTSKGLDKVQHGNIIRVAPVESLKKEREVALANDKAAKQLEPLKLKVFNVNYADAKDMESRVKNLLSERGKSDTDERTNTLIVEDIAENLSRVENLMRVLDTQTPQVRIESRIVQANDRFLRSVGIQWGPTVRLDAINGKETDWQFPRTINVGTPQGGGGFEQPTAGALSNWAVDALPGSQFTGGALGLRMGSVSNIFNLDLQLRYAENEQFGRVVSRPSITVLDNKTASIIQGSRIPFLSSSSEGSNVQFQEAGVEISVTPQITNDGAVILQVAARSNEPGSENVGGNPIINIREASTEMLVKSGRTAVMGGVFRTSDTKGVGGVPGLMNIPVLGWMFKGQSRSSLREETLIFLTPHILTDAREPVLTPDSASSAR